ncbi:MAG: nucleoporin, partial [Puniceicoccales bacterium]|nr:nucleoporin [Puniceicoccales bacterium]
MKNNIYILILLGLGLTESRAANNPFNQSPNPFGQSPFGVVANNPNPFAQSPSPFNQASQSPFGVVANNPKPNPFGQSPFNQGASASPFLLGNQNLKPIIADSEFQKCNPEQQNSSLGYADQLIKEGKDAQFAVNVGIYMLSLYVKGFDKKRVEEIKPIIADSDFQKCTPEQQKYIFAYANRLMQEGKDAQFAVNVGIDMSSIYVKGINKKRVNYLKRIVTNSGFQKCNPEQKEYIIDYVFQMMNDRNKPQFAFKVGMDMVFLYSKKIDQMLPNQIKEVNESGGMAARDVDNFTKIKKAVEALAELMATKDSDDKPNGNYKIISDYLSKQCTLTSECRASQAMRYFLLKQRTDEKALEQNLWGHGKPNWYMKLNTKEEKKAAMKDRYGESFPKYQLYNLGKVKTFSINELKEKFDRYIERHKYTPREYAKTVTMYKAFTAIALKKIN